VKIENGKLSKNVHGHDYLIKEKVLLMAQHYSLFWFNTKAFPSETMFPRRIPAVVTLTGRSLVLSFARKPGGF